MSKKILWFDVETTGLDPKKNAIIQLAALIDIDGVIVDELELLIQPHDGAKIDDVALEINGRRPEEIIKQPFMQPAQALSELLKFMNKHVDQYDKKDKFFIGGYNARFDTDFLSEFFRRLGSKYLGSYINWTILDPMYIINIMIYTGVLKLDNRQLLTVCNSFGIELGADAHDAIADIKATRELFGKLVKVSFSDSMAGL